MLRPTRLLSNAALAAGSIAVLALGGVPLGVRAADHLDAPNLGSISVDGSDNLSVSKLNGPLDINDTYVFAAASGDRTVLAMTVNPAINLGIGPSGFQPGAKYTFNVDRNLDTRPDLRYEIVFTRPNAAGKQHYEVSLTDGGEAREVAEGSTGSIGAATDGVRAFAGQRSDPFFFDLLGFLGSVKHEGTRRLDDGRQSDFFAHLNTDAIVLEVPNSQLGGDGRTIGVWTTTQAKGTDRRWQQFDQMGRPAINTVFNPTAADKELFNVTPPSMQRTAAGGKFVLNVVNTLEAFSSLDSEGAYTSTQASTLANILIPDMLTYRVGSVAAGPLNGRGLRDDVIDAELNIVTGGFPFAGRNATGAIPTDGIGPHTDYLSVFPYLGMPH